jgi:uroporphyrinogen decarboxylase
MNHRERIKTIISGQAADRCGFWMGNPHTDSWPKLHGYFGTRTKEELQLKLNDDFRWIAPHDYESTYRHPRGRAMFDLQMTKTEHGQPGPFANCEDPREVEDYEWPSLDYLNFDKTVADLRSAGDVYRASGMWTCFYHNVMDYFGMENYMMKMYTHPKVVEAVTDRVCQFYYDANERLYALAGDSIDAYFFGNDFGTQLDLICGPRQFDQFILPWFRRFTEQGHAHGYQVILHSCGSIFRVIDRLIDAGVDCLHPLQAKARNMDAETLARHFKGRIAFLGGIDTQDILIHATPEEIKTEVRRVCGLLGPGLIVSPSHEAILPDVPPENVEAMAEAATEG